jgi:hypothetical protein
MKCVFALVAGMGLFGVAACSNTPTSITAPSFSAGGGSAGAGAATSAGREAAAVNQGARCEALAAQLRTAVQAGRITAEAARKRYAVSCSPTSGRR